MLSFVSVKPTKSAVETVCRMCVLRLCNLLYIHCTSLFSSALSIKSIDTFNHADYPSANVAAPVVVVNMQTYVT